MCYVLCAGCAGWRQVPVKGLVSRLKGSLPPVSQCVSVASCQVWPAGDYQIKQTE